LWRGGGVFVALRYYFYNLSCIFLCSSSSSSPFSSSSSHLFRSSSFLVLIPRPCYMCQATAEASLWSSIRRILCYPYLRAHTAASLCCRDACTIVQLGRRCVLRCLLHVQATLATANDHQGYYLLNKVCINFGKKSLTYLTRALQEEGEGEGGGLLQFCTNS